MVVLRRAAVLSWLIAGFVILGLPRDVLARGPEVRIADNILIVPDANARAITGWLIVKAGCADEVNGTCLGIAHYLEHLLFINRDDEHRSKVAFFADGSGNGWTTHRTTAYFQRFPSRAETNGERLDKLMAYFAGLLADVRVEGSQAQRERNVVLQEYQQNTGRNPFARFNVDLNLALMPNEPLGQRVIGSPETIAKFTPEAARDFHNQWYTRDNAVIVLHGPIEPDAIRALAAKYIAALPSRKVPENIWKAPRPYEAAQLTLRTREKDARQTGVYLEKIITYEPKPADQGAMQAAQTILSSFLASRLKDSPLENLMERDGLVTQARFSIGSVREGALRLSFSAVPAEGVDPEAVVTAARGYIAELAGKGLGEATVNRLKLRIANERNLLSEQPGLYAQALVGWMSAHYSYESWLERSSHHDTVTVASVNGLLGLLAGPGREVAGIMLPEAGRASGPAGGRSVPPAIDALPSGAPPQVQP